MLQELLHIREALFASTNIAKDAQYRWKREIIENNIYGVDIDRFATQIAALRLWLSLAIESDDPHPLPNLKYKIGCGDSLLAPLEIFGQGNLHRRALIEQFRARKKEYTDADNYPEKAGAEAEIERLRVDIARTLHHLPEPPSPAKLILARNSVEPLRKKVNDALKRHDKGSAEKNQKNLDALLADIARWEVDQTDEHYDTGDVFDWSVEFAEVFEDGGFDIVLANPPYVKEDVNRDAFEGLRNAECYQGKMDLWYLFGCRTLDILKVKGSMCFIAINNWITNDGASRFRNKILSQSRIAEVLDFGDHKIFSAGVQTMVFVVIKEPPPSVYSVRYGRLMSDRVSESTLLEFLRGYGNGSNEHYVRYASVLRPDELRDDYIRFLPEKVCRITERMQAESNFRLNDSEIHSGIDITQDFVTRKHLEKLGTTAKVGDGIFVLSDAEKKSYDWNPAESHLLKPFYTTREISRYWANPVNRFWIIYTRNTINQQIRQFPKIKVHLDRFQDVITSVNRPYGLHRARNENIFLGSKILATRKCAVPTFALVDFPCYVARSFLIIKPAAHIDLTYLVALLNSKLVAFWLWHKAKIQGNQYQVDVVPITRIPLFVPDEERQRRIADLGNLVVQAKWKDRGADVSLMEDQINQLIYELYRLTADEVAIVEGDWKGIE